MEISLNIIKKAIGYDKVEAVAAPGCHRFDILPEDKSLPKAYIIFNVYEGEYSILQAGFSEWHDHFEDFREDDANIKSALEFFKDLVAGRCYLLAEFDAEGNYRSGRMIHPTQATSLMGAWPFELNPSPTTLKKLQFNKPLEVVEADTKKL